MSKPTDASGPDAGRDDASDPGACPVAWCPVCLAVSAVQPLAPDVVTHLLKAGTEMFLALQAIIDSRGEDLDDAATPEPVRLEKIDVG